MHGNDFCSSPNDNADAIPCCSLVSEQINCQKVGRMATRYKGGGWWLKLRTDHVLADLTVSKGGFWFYKKFSSELVEEQKKVANQHFKLYLAFSHIPNLTHCACIPGTLERYFNLNASSTKISVGFLKSQRCFLNSLEIVSRAALTRDHNYNWTQQTTQTGQYF